MNSLLRRAPAAAAAARQFTASCPKAITSTVGTSAAATHHRSYHTTQSASSPDWHGTTIVCVRKNGRVCMMGDGMVSMGSVIVKPNAKKIRRIYPKTIGEERSKQQLNPDDGDGANDNENEGTIVGFAGSTADAFTLLERLEGKLDEYPGQLARSCVELAKGWRTDKYLRRLEASLLVADKKDSFEITGNGDVLESHDGVLGVGSGSNFAIAAARAQMDNPDLSAEDVAKKAMQIASEMCIYTNDQFMVESLAMVKEDKVTEE
uniref:ATP-dependent protease subunit HslV n=1 Tax=Skeletonema marinoi TaxID=267567 RepID=A0A7S2VFY7_9STRA|mmetsp:Transcript_22384/g.34392  ORF Transcript_22384/g.34392 Transcript_22384/m.34392 type:complete len:263 (+) Transcript_22384:107-895(+)|eukprot:scaffold4046_cov210-Skeletonema_marinoi.AAC.1